MALPTALFAMVPSLGLAGASAARMRLIRHQVSLNGQSPCVGPNGEAQIPSGGRCPAASPVSIGDAIYTYRFSAAGACCAGYALCPVSTGTADGVSPAG